MAGVKAKLRPTAQEEYIVLDSPRTVDGRTFWPALYSIGVGLYQQVLMSDELLVDLERREKK